MSSQATEAAVRSDRNTPASLGVAGATVSFGGVKALSDVTFEVSSGEVAALVGPNGAGKTTIINAVGGLLRRNLHGTISLDDQRIDRLAPSKVTRMGVARSFQHPPLLERETVMENILLGPHLRLGYTLIDEYVRWGKVRRAEDSLAEEAYEYMRLLGIAQSALKPAGSVPYAVTKLADIARALLMRPRLLLLDEPTSGLGSGEREMFASALADVRAQRPVTVLMVEHHMELVRLLADKVVGLQAGAVLRTGTPTEVLNSAEFRVALVGGVRHQARAGSDPSMQKEG